MDSKMAALQKMVSVCSREMKLCNALESAGYERTSHFDAWSELCDAIRYFIGEKTDTDFIYSYTYLILMKDLSVQTKTEILMQEYERNHPDYPGPITMEQTEIKQMVRKNGGYLFETPEGDWS